jgi:predicted outer membrane repeat protein
MKKILFICLVFISGIATSAIFQVNLTVQDQIDGDPGDGVCEIPTGGFCTLRAAIMEANALAGSDIIVLPGNATINLSIPGADENAAATGDLDITDAVAIGAFTESTADFPTIDANDINDRVFHVLGNSGAVSFVNFRIINGSTDFSNGGAINVSINNQVNVVRVWFEDNTANSGGAIYASALSELDIVDSVFTGNAAVSQGAAITAFSPTEIDQSTVYDNLNFNSEFKEAIFIGLDDFGSSSLSLRNSTVFNNSDSGVYAVAADVSIRNSTIANHSARGVAINPGSGITPDLRIRNSVFNQNGLNCSSGVVNRVTDNWNITSDANFCYEISELQDSTTLTEDPKLTSIKVDAEGWHRYYRPGFFSPVVDSAHPVTPGPGLGCDAADQRGVLRPQDAGSDGNDRCDRGAIELLEDVIFFDNLDIIY